MTASLLPMPFDPKSADVMTDSTILNSTTRNYVYSLFKADFTKTTLCYRATAHGFDVNQFHSRCNHKGASISLIKTAKGRIFGGFTHLAWRSMNTYVVDAKAYLFSVDNEEKMSVSAAGTNAIFDHQSYGPTFGSGHDFTVPSSATNANQNSYSNLGTSYPVPKYFKGKADTFLAGERNFATAEIEVWILGV